MKMSPEVSMKFVVFIVFLFDYFSLSAYVLVVESPGMESLMSSQMILMNEIAMDKKMSDFEHFTEYLAQFANVVSTIKKGQEAASKVMKIASVLKNKSAGDWLAEVEDGLKGTFPEMAGFVSSVEGGMAGEVAAGGGKYAEYISSWNSKMRDYHAELLENYGNHTVFPELFPALAKSGKDFVNAENAQKIVHKAWLESGMEYEMKNDGVRGGMFRRYYEEYMKSAKENDNIEALGLANLMQASYISTETLEHIRKNLDLKVMKEQFNRDSAESYFQFLSDEKNENGMTKERKNTVFGL